MGENVRLRVKLLLGLALFAVPAYVALITAHIQSAELHNKIHVYFYSHAEEYDQLKAGLKKSEDQYHQLYALKDLHEHAYQNQVQMLEMYAKVYGKLCELERDMEKTVRHR